MVSKSREAANVLVVDDNDAFRRVLTRELQRRGWKVEGVGSGGEAIEKARHKGIHLVLLDLKLPDLDGIAVLKQLKEIVPDVQVVMLTGHGTIDSAIAAIRLGAADYVTKPCPVEELEVRMEKALDNMALRQRTVLLERGLSPADPEGVLLGVSRAMRGVLELVERVAPTDVSVLITGETGVGKELVARLIHARSNRADRPFVVIECAVLQESLFQSECFGYERGAFTGAERSKPGLFEVANGGTVFLDEVGEISPAMQVKLLRVLENGTFRRVGGTQERHCDVRIVAATNRDLNALRERGFFREDFFYRIRTVWIQIPPLRERPEDIPVLVEHFVRRFSEKFGVERVLSEDALEALQAYDWPGNVRELLHTIECAVAVGGGPRVTLEDLPRNVRRRARGRTLSDIGVTSSEPRGLEVRPLREVERELILRALDVSGGHRQKAANLLGISERTLYRKLKRLGLV